MGKRQLPWPLEEAGQILTLSGMQFVMEIYFKRTTRMEYPYSSSLDSSCSEQEETSGYRYNIREEDSIV